MSAHAVKATDNVPAPDLEPIASGLSVVSDGKFGQHYRDEVEPELWFRMRLRTPQPDFPGLDSVVLPVSFPSLAVAQAAGEIFMDALDRIEALRGTPLPENCEHASTRTYEFRNVPRKVICEFCNAQIE